MHYLQIVQRIEDIEKAINELILKYKKYMEEKRVVIAESIATEILRLKHTLRINQDLAIFLFDIRFKENYLVN